MCLPFIVFIIQWMRYKLGGIDKDASIQISATFLVIVYDLRYKLCLQLHFENILVVSEPQVQWLSHKMSSDLSVHQIARWCMDAECQPRYHVIANAGSRVVAVGMAVAMVARAGIIASVRHVFLPTVGTC